MYIAIPRPELAHSGADVRRSLRRQGVNVAIDFGEKKLGDQIKTAAKHKIPYLIVLRREMNWRQGKFTVRGTFQMARRK